MGLKSGVAAIVIGLLMASGAAISKRLITTSSAEPQEIGCAELGEQGPGDNINVVVTDLQFGDDFVFKNIGGVAENQGFSKIWIPLYPARGAAKGAFNVLLMSSKVHDEKALDALCRQSTVSGLVINDVSEIEDEERNLLAESYPNTRFASVWIVEHERTPPNTAVILGQAVVSLVLIIAGAIACKNHFTA